LRGFVNKRTGIAGYSGSGKSTVARLLAASSPAALVIDADTEAKKFISSDRVIIRRLIEVFGPQVLENSEINFGFLGTRVFGSKEQLLQYNAIVHPPFYSRLRALVDEQGDKQVILDAALIPLWGIESWFDRCIWVHASFATRVLRVKSRWGNQEQGFIENRLRLQEEIMKEPVGRCWVRLENEGCLEGISDALNDLRYNA
jgi:dephospho-CoA kinase